MLLNYYRVIGACLFLFIGAFAQAQICDGGLDANWMAVHGFPAVTMGCGQHDIHTVQERLFIPEYLAACKAGLTLAAGI